jgi:hypothetical protein
MKTLTTTPTSPVTVVRWLARLGGLLFIGATLIIDVIVIAEMIGGKGPNWATLSAGQLASVVMAFGLPLVTIIGVVIAWLRKGIGEGIGGALIALAALIAMVSSFIGPDAGGASMAMSSFPMLLVGAGFLYCWWDTRRSPSAAR